MNVMREHIDYDRPESREPHTVVSEHLQGARWTETARQPVRVPPRQADDLRRFLESLSAIIVLLVRTEAVDEARLRLRVLDPVGTTIATVHGDGSITLTSPGDI